MLSLLYIKYTEFVNDNLKYCLTYYNKYIMH